jgi:hypothetical protein
MSGGISASTIAIGAAAAAGGMMLAKSLAGKPSAPQAQAPVTVEADANQASADASAAGIASRTAKRRAMRAQSLLATGAGGDTSNVITGTPSATAGKTTLGG